MTHMQVQMPERLTVKEVESIVYVFFKMSLASKQSFLAALIMDHPEHFIRISKVIGEEGMSAVAQA